MKTEVRWKDGRYRIVDANPDDEYHVCVNMLRDAYGTEYNPPKKVYDHKIIIVNSLDWKRFGCEEEGIYEIFLVNENRKRDPESLQRGFIGAEHWFECECYDDGSFLTYDIQTDIDLNATGSGSISGGGLVYFDGENYLPLPRMIPGRDDVYAVKVVVERKEESAIMLDTIWSGAVPEGSVRWIKGE